MTQQAEDVIVYQNEEYVLLDFTGRLGRSVFQKYDLNNGQMSMANHRGYTAKYLIDGSKLFMTWLSVEDGSGDNKPIGDVLPKKTQMTREGGDYDSVYHDLREEIRFNGHFVIGRNYVTDMASTFFVSFEYLLKLHFDDGGLIKVDDVSVEARVLRVQLHKMFENVLPTDVANYMKVFESKEAQDLYIQANELVRLEMKSTKGD